MLNISEKTYWPEAESAVKAYSRRAFANYFSEDALDDITAVVVTRMYEKRDQYDESRGTVTAWVGMIARNAVLDAYRAETRRRAFFSSACLVEMTDDDGDVVNYVPAAPDETDAWLIVRDTERALRCAATTERDKRILDGMIQGRDSSELATAEGVETSRIYTPVHHLRERLRRVA